MWKVQLRWSGSLRGKVYCFTMEKFSFAGGLVAGVIFWGDYLGLIE